MHYHGTKWSYCDLSHIDWALWIGHWSKREENGVSIWLDNYNSPIWNKVKSFRIRIQYLPRDTLYIYIQIEMWYMIYSSGNCQKWVCSQPQRAYNGNTKPYPAQQTDLLNWVSFNNQDFKHVGYVKCKPLFMGDDHHFPIVLHIFPQLPHRFPGYSIIYRKYSTIP